MPAIARIVNVVCNRPGTSIPGRPSALQHCKSIRKASLEAPPNDMPWKPMNLQYEIVKRVEAPSLFLPLEDFFLNFFVDFFFSVFLSLSIRPMNFVPVGPLNQVNWWVGLVLDMRISRYKDRKEVVWGNQEQWVIITLYQPVGLV